MPFSPKPSVNVLSWDDLRYFLAIARRGSSNAAARELGVDHTTVGRRLKALEGRLGTPLFERREQRLELTIAGKITFEEAENIEAAVNAVSLKVNNISTDSVGEIRLILSEGLGVYWLLPLLQDFIVANPGIKLEWYLSNLVEGDLKREFDVGVWWWRPDEPQFVARRLGLVNYSLFAAPEYVKQHGMVNNLDELSNHFVVHHTGYDRNTGFDEWNARIRTLPRVTRYENSTLAEGFVKSGKAIALLPDYVTQILPGAIRMPIATGVSLELWLVFHEDRRRITRIRMLADEIYRLAEAAKGTWFSSED